jgi:hypothetical protein
VRTRRAPAPLVALVTVLALAFAAGACSDDDDDGGTGGAATTTAAGAPGGVADPTAVPTGATPADSLEAAVQTLLTAEQAGDHATSYALLDAVSRAEFTSQGDWERRRSQLPTMTGFRIERAEDTGVVALVQHQPGLDPFVGLSADERQTWTGVETALGWLVDGEPDRVYVLPPDDAVAPAAKTWAEAVQRCDQAARGHRRRRGARVRSGEQRHRGPVHHGRAHVDPGRAHRRPGRVRPRHGPHRRHLAGPRHHRLTA